MIETTIHPHNDLFYILLYPLTELDLQLDKQELAASLLGAASRYWSPTQFYITYPMYKASMAALTTATEARLPVAAYQSAYAFGSNLTREALLSMIVAWLNDLSNSDRIALH